MNCTICGKPIETDPTKERRGRKKTKHNRKDNPTCDKIYNAGMKKQYDDSRAIRSIKNIVTEELNPTVTDFIEI